MKDLTKLIDKVDKSFGASSFLIDKLIDGGDRLEISIAACAPSEGTLVCSFASYHGYRKFNESDLEKLWVEVGRLECGLYMTDRSEFLTWAKESTTFDAYADLLRHFLLISLEDVVEVLSTQAPQFTK